MPFTKAILNLGKKTQSSPSTCPPPYSERDVSKSCTFKVVVRPVAPDHARSYRDLFSDFFSSSLLCTLDGLLSVERYKAIFGIAPTLTSFINAAVAEKQADDAHSDLAVPPSIIESISPKVLDGKVLGVVIVSPFWLGQDQKTCYNRAGRVILVVASESVLGLELSHNIKHALLTEALRKCSLTGCRFENLTAEFNYRKDIAELQADVEIYLEHGFEQTGLFKRVVEKKGIVLDRIILQRDLIAGAAPKES